MPAFPEPDRLHRLLIKVYNKIFRLWGTLLNLYESAPP